MQHAIDIILDRAAGMSLEELTADRMLYGGTTFGKAARV